MVRGLDQSVAEVFRFIEHVLVHRVFPVQYDPLLPGRVGLHITDFAPGADRERQTGRFQITVAADHGHIRHVVSHVFE